MSIQPSQPQSIGGVLDTTFQLYKASVMKMIPLSLLVVIAGSPQSIYVFTQGGLANPGDPFAMQDRELVLDVLREKWMEGK